MQYASFIRHLSASHFVWDLFVAYLGITAIVLGWLWIARLTRSTAPSQVPSENTKDSKGASRDRVPQLKASELTWLKKQQIEELAQLLDADILGLHRMKAIKVLCQSGLQQHHLDAVSRSTLPV